MFMALLLSLHAFSAFHLQVETYWNVKQMHINRRNMHDSFALSLAIKVLSCAVADDNKKE
jgi:hypothetical protein